MSVPLVAMDSPVNAERSDTGHLRLPGVNWYAPSLAGIILAGAAWRAFYIVSGRSSFDSDQVIFGIGALHLLGGGRPHIMIPGQHYGGYFPSFYFLVLHWFFPPCAAVMKLGMIPVACLLGALGALAGRTLFSSRAAGIAVAVAFMFSPSTPLDLFTRASTIFIWSIVPVVAAIPLIALVLEELAAESPDMAYCRNCMLGAGALVGFGVWGTPAALIYMLGLAVGVAKTRGALTRVTGLRDLWRDGNPGPRRAVGVTWQLAMLGAFAWLSHLLLNGDGEVAAAQSRLATTVLLTVFLSAGWAVSVAVTKQKWPPSVWLLPLGFVGLWLGAAPVIWYQWVDGVQTKDFMRLVRDERQAVAQLLSVFESGIPMLAGYYNNWVKVPPGMPMALRLVALVGYCLPLVVLLVVSCWPRARFDVRTRFGIHAICSMSLIQIAVFALSFDGRFVEEPRYLLILFVCMALSVGACCAWMSAWGGWWRALAVAFLVALVVAGVASGLSMRPMRLERWTLENPLDLALRQTLMERGITRVSARFDTEGYWSTYKNTYQAAERIIFVPAETPNGLDIRSREHQALVDTAPEIAYMVRDGQQELVTRYLALRGAKWEGFACQPFFVIHKVEPDVLRTLRDRHALQVALEQVEAAEQTR